MENIIKKIEDRYQKIKHVFEQKRRKLSISPINSLPRLTAEIIQTTERFNEIAKINAFVSQSTTADEVLDFINERILEIKEKMVETETWFQSETDPMQNAAKQYKMIGMRYAILDLKDLKIFITIK